MRAEAIVAQRLRSHRLSAPARSVTDAAAHMLAVQAQDFAAGRWALGVRTRGAPTRADVDAALDRGDIVRSWTMRGTLHLVPARDLAWLLSLTAQRQQRAAAGVHRREGLDAAELDRAEQLALAALAGGGRLTRDELSAVLERGGVVAAGQRGYHLLVALSLRGGVCLGPVVPRAGGLTHEQYIVRTDEWVPEAPAPADPAAEMFARYIAGHGPAGARDFAWWSGLPLTVARSAAAAAGERVRVVADDPEPRYAAASPAPRRAASAPAVTALAPFDEYYLSYADRSTVCAADAAARVGPGVNGMVRGTILVEGRVAGTWRAGARGQAPVADLFEPLPADAVTAALARYTAFLRP
jgi:hypothetical protein